MTTKTLPLDYANDLMFELEKAFWDERGKGARFRMTTVGREYYKSKVLPALKEAELESILATVKGVLESEGIVGELGYDRDERLLSLTIKGCLHRRVEERMAALNIEPVACMPANLVVLAIEEKLNRQVELAEIKLVEGACKLLLVLFDQRPAQA
jgi:hypothetical protein